MASWLHSYPSVKLVGCTLNYVRACVLAYMHACVYVYVHVCHKATLCIRLAGRTFNFLRAIACVRACVRVCVCVCVFVFVCTCVYVLKLHCDKLVGCILYNYCSINTITGNDHDKTTSHVI